MPTRLTDTVPEVAELLGISRSSAYECVRRAEIPSLVLGRRVVVARVALEKLIAATVQRGPDHGNPALRISAGSDRRE